SVLAQIILYYRILILRQYGFFQHLYRIVQTRITRYRSASISTISFARRHEYTNRSSFLLQISLYRFSQHIWSIITESTRVMVNESILRGILTVQGLYRINQWKLLGIIQIRSLTLTYNRIVCTRSIKLLHRQVIRTYIRLYVCVIFFRDGSIFFCTSANYSNKSKGY